MTKDIRPRVDWPEFMARQDMIWDRMPVDYFEGAFVGNGLLGTILFLDDQEPNTLRFEIGRTDVYDHRKPGTGMDREVSSTYAGGFANAEWRSWFTAAVHDRVRLPIGQLLLTPVGTITGTCLRADLWNAEVRGTITTESGEIDLRCFVPCGTEVIVIDVRTRGGERACRFKLRPQQGTSPRFIAAPDRDTQFGVNDFAYIPNPEFQVKQIEGMEVAVQPLLAGSDYATAWKEVASSSDGRTVYLSVANRLARMGSSAEAVANVRNAIKLGVASMESAHRDWWHSYYPASFVTLPDARMESFYWIQLYKMASATRRDKPVVDLMGPWFKPSVWAAYWHNLNTQLAYYSVHATNHVDLGEPLCRLLESKMDGLINNVAPEFREDSAALGNPTGYYDLVAPAPGPPPDKLGKGAYQFIALPWLMQHFYLQYRHTMDEQRLRDSIYPLLRRTFNTYLHLIELAEDGHYHIPNAFSDEYDVAEDTSMNIALLRWGLETLIATSKRLKIDDPLLPKWNDVLEKLVEYSTDEATGIMVGKGMAFSKPHRHYSHLFGVFPFYVLNMERNPEKRDLIQKSLRQFLGLDGDNCMYKFTGASSLYSALGQGDDALNALQRALTFISGDSTVTPNTLYSEIGGWQTFESPISATRSMLDMLLQSWGDKIRVFPACPQSWPDVSFHGLRAEGAFLVSAVRQGGRTKFIRVKSLAGETCRVASDLPVPPRVLGLAPSSVRVSDGVVELDMQKDQVAMLFSGEPVPDLTIEPLAHSSNDRHYWGLPDAFA